MQRWSYLAEGHTVTRAVARRDAETAKNTKTRREATREALSAAGFAGLLRFGGSLREPGRAACASLLNEEPAEICLNALAKTALRLLHK
jgi:hypothetical protein